MQASSVSSGTTSLTRSVRFYPGNAHPASLAAALCIFDCGHVSSHRRGPCEGKGTVSSNLDDLVPSRGDGLSSLNASPTLTVTFPLVTPPRNKKTGMFCYSGLNPAQVSSMINKHHIYLTEDGRISMAGVTTKNVKYLAQSMHDVVTTVQ